MAIQRWLGNAAATAQITTYTPVSPAVNMTFSATINSKAVSYTTPVGTVADVCNGLANAIAAAAYPEFQELTAQNQTTAIQLNGNVVGKPFTVAGSAAGGGGGGSVTINTAVAATGPNDWANAANWSTGSAPTAGDDVYFDIGNISCLYNLDQHAVTLSSLNIFQMYTGTIGLPIYNAGGYREYRPLELALAATTVNVGQGGGNGSGRIKLNVGSSACTLNIYNTGQPADQGVPSLTWRGASGSNVVSVNKGSVGLAIFPGDAAAVATLNVGYVSNVQGDVQLICGLGATIATVNQNGGFVQLNNGATTINANAGTMTVWSGAVTTLSINGTTVVFNSTGTLTTAEVAENGSLDFSQDQRSKTVTNTIQRYGDNSKIVDPFKVVSSLAIRLNESTDLSNLDIGENITLTRS